MTTQQITIAPNGDAPNGVVALMKPPGMTSHDAVAHVRRVLKVKRVGHTGTLDPAATGVMLICVGQATRLVEALQDGNKEYLAEATFGFETDTLDAVGETSRRCAATSIARSDVERVCESFRGVIQQRPPLHSAIKIGGQKLYEIARAGEAIEIPSRQVTIAALEVTRFFADERPRAFLRVDCSGGTYIRSLVRDIGRALDNAATMTFLTRVRNAQFTLGQSLTPQEFESKPLLMPLPEVLQNLYGSPRVDDGAIRALGQGQRVDINAELPASEVGTVTLWCNTARTVWVLARMENTEQWKPEKVFDLREN